MIGPPPPGPPPPGGPNPVDFLNQIQYILYMQVVVTVAVLYDHIITLGLEVEVIWKRKWTIVTALFLVNRYLGEALPLYLTIVQAIKPPSGPTNGANFVMPFKTIRLNDLGKLLGDPTLIVDGWGTHVLIWSMQAIMQYRICCLYKHARRIVLLVGVAFTVQIVSMLVIDGLYLNRASMTSEPQPGYVICTGYSTQWYIVSWIPVFSYELIILVLGLRAGISYFKELESLPQMARYPLHAILLCDSIMYPILAFLVGAIFVVGWSRPTSDFHLLTAALFQLFPRILGCRLILNLRETYYLPFQEEISLNDRLQTLVFARSPDETGRTE